MSRSYKKTPYCGDNKGKDKKRMANKKVRMFLKNLDHELKNNDYKKVFETYDICDFYFLETWEEYWKRCLRYYYEWNSVGISTPFPNKKEEYRNWYKMYKMK